VAGGRSVFDTVGSASPRVVDAPTVASVHAVRELTTHIPASALSDPAIQTSIDWYRGLATQKAKAEASLDKVQRDLDSQRGDRAALTAYQAQLTNEVKQMETHQRTAETAIKRRLLQLDVAWVEAPEPPDASGTEEQEP
jgi:hypothetical protein